MANQKQVGRVATSVVTENGITSVYYHGTPVVRWGGGLIVLNTGGWFTSTTKTRMNQAANQHGLGFAVHQKSRKWFVTYRGETIPFNGNNVTLPA